MSDSASGQLLPRSIDALKYCQQRLRTAGVVPLASLPRVVPVLLDDQGAVSVTLQFGLDEQSRKIVQGSVEGELTLACQRCLGAVAQHIVSDVALALVWNDEQAANLPRSLDPLLMDGTELDLYALVEDELLLALPLVAQHDEGQCDAPVFDSGEDPGDDGQTETKTNPFQVLASLKLAGKPPKTDE